MIYGTGFASLDEREDAGEMKKPDELHAVWRGVSVRCRIGSKPPATLP
jgi:hypothetical protein